MFLASLFKCLLLFQLCMCVSQYKLAIMNKRTFVLNWLNAFPCCSPLHKLEELVDEKQLIELAVIVNPIKCGKNEIDEFTLDRKIEFIKETITGHYNMDSEKLVNFNLFMIGNIAEIVKVAVLLLSAATLQLASIDPGKNKLSSLHELETKLQEQIKDSLQMILEADDANKLAFVLSELSSYGPCERLTVFSNDSCNQMRGTPLSHSTSPMHYASSTTPINKARNLRSKKIVLDSPLKTFMESPLLRHQIIIKENTKEIKSLRNSLHSEENRVFELNENYQKALVQIHHKDEDIRNLKQRVRALEPLQEIAEEYKNFKMECEENLILLEKKYSRCENCLFLEDENKKMKEHQETRNSLEEVLTNSRIKIEALQKDSLEKENLITILQLASIQDDDKIQCLTQQIDELTNVIEVYKAKCAEDNTEIDSYMEPVWTPRKFEHETLGDIIDCKNQELEEKLNEKDQQIKFLIENFEQIKNCSEADVDEIKCNIITQLGFGLKHVTSDAQRENCFKIYASRHTQTIIHDFTIDNLQVLHKNNTTEKPKNEHETYDEKYKKQSEEMKISFQGELLEKKTEVDFFEETNKRRDSGKILKLENGKVQEILDLQDEIEDYMRHIDDLNEKVRELTEDCEKMRCEKDGITSEMLKLEQDNQKLSDSCKVLNESYQSILLEHTEFKKQMNESFLFQEKIIEDQKTQINELGENVVILKNDYEHIKHKHKISIEKIKELENSKIQLQNELETSEENIKSLLSEKSVFNQNEASLSQVNEVSYLNEERLKHEKMELVTELRVLREEKCFVTETLLQLEHDKKILCQELKTLQQNYKAQHIEDDLSESFKQQIGSDESCLHQESLIQENKHALEKNETDNLKLIKLEKETIEKKIHNPLNENNFDDLNLLTSEINRHFKLLETNISETLKDDQLRYKLPKQNIQLNDLSNESIRQLQLLIENVRNFLDKYRKLDGLYYKKNEEVKCLKSHLSNMCSELEKSEIHADCEEQRFIDCRYELEHATVIDYADLKKELEREFQKQIKELENAKNAELDILVQEKSVILTDLKKVQELSKESNENLQKLEKKCNSYKTMAKESMTDSISLRETISNFIKKCESKEEENKSIALKYNKAKENIKGLAAENEVLKKRSENMNKLIVEFETLTDHNQKLKTELELSRQNISPLKRQIKVVENALRIQEEENKKLQSELRLAQNEMSEIKETTRRVDDFHKRLSFSTSDPYCLKDSPLLKKGNFDPAVTFMQKLAKTPSRSLKSPFCTPKQDNKYLHVRKEKTTLGNSDTSFDNLFENLEHTDPTKIFSTEDRLTELHRRNAAYPDHTKSSSNEDRLTELQRRNSLYPVHMRSCYPVEMQATSPSVISDETLANGQTTKKSLSEKDLSTSAKKAVKTSGNLLKDVLYVNSMSPFSEYGKDTSVKKLYQRMKKINSSTPK